MDFIDHIRDLSARIQKQANGIQTEEATKNAFIMPFIGALGYNVFDPTKVTPELVADVGTKKGEKVDYAILINGIQHAEAVQEPALPVWVSGIGSHPGDPVRGEPRVGYGRRDYEKR